MYKNRLYGHTLERAVRIGAFGSGGCGTIRSCVGSWCEAEGGGDIMLMWQVGRLLLRLLPGTPRLLLSGSCPSSSIWHVLRMTTPV